MLDRVKESPGDSDTCLLPLEVGIMKALVFLQMYRHLHKQSSLTDWYSMQQVLFNRVLIPNPTT